MHKSSEKLPHERIYVKFRRLQQLMRRRSEGIMSHRKSMTMVERRLRQWVREGKYRLDYGSMDKILDDLGLTGGELSSYCSKKFNKSFLSWRKELRIKEAKKRLLDSPEVPAYRIGRELGISDKSDFRHQFKSITGYTPGQWREKYLKK